MSCAFSCLKGRHHAVGNFEGWFGITGTIPKCRNLQFGGSLYFSKISVVNLTLYFLLKEFRIGFDRKTVLFQGVFLKHEIRGSDVDQSGHDQRPNRLRGHYQYHYQVLSTGINRWLKSSQKLGLCVWLAHIIH